MQTKDLLYPKTFQNLWKDRERNDKFQKFLLYFGIDWETTQLIFDEKYIILYSEKTSEFIVFSSKKHPLEIDFLERKQQLGIQNFRVILLR